MANLWVFWALLIFLDTLLVATTCMDVQNATRICHEQERLALLRFKYSVKDDFKMLSSWVGLDCCSWDRVRCDGTTGRVVGLDLRGHKGGVSYSCWVSGLLRSSTETIEIDDLVGEEYYLVGETINSSLGELRHLKYLDLSENDFQGSRIPEFIGSLKQLSYLNLSNAGFSGNIPHHIGNLSNLKVLSLSSLSYFPTLKADDLTWISGLSSIEYLDLNGVNLSEAKNRHMVLYMTPSVIHLSLSCCGFSDANLVSPHLNFSRKLPNIKFLHLKDNAIEGRFPLVVTNMSSLVSLGLSGNILNSSIPYIPSLQKLDISNNNFRLIHRIGVWRQCNLKELIVSDNDLEGEMYWPLNNSSKCSQYALNVLDLSFNQLSGSIPKSIGRLTGLRELHLTSNNLEGPIPQTLGRLKSLEVLDLSYNRIDGPIPTFFGQLTELDLSHNHLNYSIPKSFGNLATLTYLNLGCNRLTGPIPTSIGRLVKLEIFLVSSNLLDGIPFSVGKLTKLEILDVSNNSLEGIVFEAHFSNLSKLEYLDLSSNKNLTFKVSREWIPPFQLSSIRLGSCNILDEFPKWLQTQKKLFELVLSNASIYGPLPTWLRNMPIISVLDLSHNKLSGPLNLPFGKPLNRFNAEYMRSLYLQNNLFNGSIPMSLCTSYGLEFLDLSKNKLSGRIPNCLANLQNLRMIILSSNELYGVIPSSLGHISPTLLWLNLNNNKLIGELPQGLGNLQDLRVLDLGDNKFSGKIPEWIGEKLTSLMVLRLHKNNFNGRIPQSLCKNSYLHILDIAHNNLNGEIPHCFWKLHGMVETSDNNIRNGSNSKSDESVSQVMKGIDREYSKNLDLLFNIDLSSNKLVGQIPKELMTLSLLVGLNLSHNHLSGVIPNGIGNLKSINSLDFSYNELSGIIPSSMASLYFLSHLNLSCNNLSGRIPTGNQLQTLTDPSIYVGNRDLCGDPLPRNCSNPKDPTTTRTNNDHKELDELEEWFYLSVICGLATGFWGVIGVLLNKKQWRHKLFMLADVTMDAINVAVVRVSKMKRKGRDAT